MNTYELPVSGEIPDAVRRDMDATLSAREQRIVSDLHRVAVDAVAGRPTSDTFWTRGIKSALTAFAGEQNLLCCHSGTAGEWLYDVCWVETAAGATATNAWRSAQRLKLACEIEWSEHEDDILWDFMKLTWAQADLRLFVYTNHMKRGASQHPAALCREHCAPSAGSRFLLVGFPKWVEDGEPFRIDAWGTHAEEER
jgi:hypothetical protein